MRSRAPLAARVLPRAAARRRAPIAPRAASSDPPLHIACGNALTVDVREPMFDIAVRYDAAGGPLAGSAAVTARCGHSGWQDAVEVALTQASNETPDSDETRASDDVWVGSISIKVSRLPSPARLELQAAFAGASPSGDVRWDNNAGADYAIAVDVARGVGLAAAPARRARAAAAASLLVRLDALAASRALPPEAVALLRTLAWQGDGALLAAFDAARGGDDASLAAALGARCGVAARPGLHVVHVASEAAPFAKVCAGQERGVRAARPAAAPPPPLARPQVGGLADVVTGLARAHQATGTLAEMVLPKYDCGDYASLTDLRVLGQLSVPWRGATAQVAVWAAVCGGVPAYLLEPAPAGGGGAPPFWRGAFYGQPDDASRFLLFAAAAVEFLAWSGRTPDVVHAHDWQAAAVPLLLRLGGTGGGAGPLPRALSARPATVLTIHNLAFQGRTNPGSLADVPALAPGALPAWAASALADPRAGPGGAPDANLLKAAIETCDVVTTVSPTYAAEVVAAGGGHGLETALAAAARSNRFVGVVNGIDVDAYDPSNDAALPLPYDASTAAAGKAAAKAALLAEVGLAATTLPTPLLAVVSRLTDQKGVALIEAGIAAAVAGGAQVVVLGTAPDPAVDARFRAAAAAAAAGNSARYCLFFSEALSRRIYAAADLILMPSLWEPCGLSQLLALRYGAIPVARRTGGLAATLTDLDEAGAPDHARAAFLFDAPTGDECARTVRRALAARAAPGGVEWWAGVLVPRAMRQDWSWSRSAADYLGLYRDAAGRRPQA